MVEKPKYLFFHTRSRVKKVWRWKTAILHHHVQQDAFCERVRCHALGFLLRLLQHDASALPQPQEHVVWTVPPLTWLDTTSYHERGLRNSLLSCGS